VFSKSKIFKFLKRDCGTIPVVEIISGKIEFFSKHQRFLIATESSKYLLIFVLYVCVILCEFGTAISKRYACFCCLFKTSFYPRLCPQISECFKIMFLLSCTAINAVISI
jgi:hypothetical protein